MQLHQNIFDANHDSQKQHMLKPSPAQHPAKKKRQSILIPSSKEAALQSANELTTTKYDKRKWTNSKSNDTLYSIYKKSNEQANAMKIPSSEITDIQITPRKDSHTIVFTDASKPLQDGPVGAAAIICNGNENLAITTLLGTEHSVHEGELFAILQALQHIQLTPPSNDETEHEVFILCDSQTALKAIDKLDPLGVIEKCINDLAHAQKHIKFHWIPAHNNNPGNVLADFFARHITTDENIAPISLNTANKQQTKQKLTKWTKEQWQEKWDTSEKGRHTHRLIEQVGTTNLYEPVINKLLSGHFPSNDYLYRFGLRSSNRCERCRLDAAEDILHLIIDCPFYQHLRPRVPSLKYLLFRSDYIFKIVRWRSRK